MYVLVLLLLSVSIHFSLGVDTHYASRVPPLDNLIFTDEHFTLLTTMRNLRLCLIECGNNINCVTFSYHKPTGGCRLYKTGFYKAPMGVSFMNWKYYAYGSPACPIQLGFVYYRVEELCLFESTFATDFHSASTYCTERGARVLTLETAAKQTNVEYVFLLTDSLESYWIGLNPSLGQWSWTTGLALTAPKWGTGQPTCLPNGNICLCAKTVKGWNWRWNDCNCMEPGRFVCEHDI